MYLHHFGAARARLQELVDQVAVTSVKLNPVETGGDGVARGVPVVFDEARQFGKLRPGGEAQGDITCTGIGGDL